ncbi:Uma2 family endonuclease [Aeromicrobium piscarium]
MAAEMMSLPRGRPFTRDDLDAMPDDGHRYELLDGVLVVSPAPRYVHQLAVGELHLLLHAAVPEDAQVLFAPFDVVLAADTVLQPDLLVAPRDAFTERDLPTAPLLAIEVLSPSTRRFDLLLKKERLERAGCQHYWVVDPEEPSITAWKLEDGAYHQIARVIGDDRFDVAEPFAIGFAPADLVP